MKALIIVIFYAFSSFNLLFAQNDIQDLKNLILSKDSMFWEAYNACNIEAMQQFVADDVEFFHDKGGITAGRENLINSIGKNLCGNENLRLRRTAITTSVNVYPLKNNAVLYGAIISGEHVFSVLEKGKPERPDGLAKFTHIWVLEKESWKMSRILSYDHGPASQTKERIEIKISESTLNKLAGRYAAPQSGLCNVKRDGGTLSLVIGDQKYILYPFGQNLFFVKDRDLTFEFTEGPSRMVVRENGNIVEEAVKQKE